MARRKATALRSTRRAEVESVAVARFEHFLREEWRGCSAHELDQELETYRGRWRASTALDQLLGLRAPLEPLGRILFAVEYASVKAFLDRQRARPIEQFDQVTSLPTSELTRRARVLHEAAELLAPSDLAAFLRGRRALAPAAEVPAEWDLAVRVHRQAVAHEGAATIRRKVLGPWFHPLPVMAQVRDRSGVLRRFPKQQPGSLRILGEALDENMPKLDQGRRDALAVALFRDFFDDEESAEVVTKRLREQMKAPRRRRKMGVSA